ncbi:unnamed protein product [Coffea canephora]|uniref:NADP-dependent oxidoreductase domain-containing protein n=1 Tax=Coffea canephora TaxID=49390 RepID=A0A068UE26_COFCA|nr:unnamed protein product [Coffea canephora]
MADQVEMPRVKLGSQGLELKHILGFGCMGLTGIYNAAIPEDDGIAILKEAFSKGVTFWDTADIYGEEHANEYLVGKALKQLPREKVQLATKFGVFKFEPSKVTVKGTPEYVRSCCEGSLKRLQMDYIDLYYIHCIDTTVPIEETMGELKKLVEEGKIKYIGLSEASPDTIRRAHAVHPITAIQQEYSLWTRDIEPELLPLCSYKFLFLLFFFCIFHVLHSFISFSFPCNRISIHGELGIGIVPYSPVGRGLFAGKAVVESLPQNSYLKFSPRFMGDNFEKNKTIYFRLDALAKKHGCTPAQLAIAWVLHRGDDIAPIPGTTKIKNLHDNIGSVKVELTEEDLKEISDAVPVDGLAGGSFAIHS